MTGMDKCRMMSLANNIGARYFNDASITNDERVGALRAIRELIDEIMELPEDDYSLDPLTGEKRWP